ncbi:MAG: hypothetical protein V7603_2302 [Micromonosporaceae bacterium]
MGVRALFEGILTNLVAALPLLLVGLLSGWVSRYVFERHAIRRSLGFPHERIHIVLATPLYITPGTNRPKRSPGVPMATIGTVFAYQHVVNLLLRGYPGMRKVSLYFSDDFPPSFYEDNLILIGFPQTNRVTRSVMARLALPIQFDDHVLVERETSRSFCARVESGSITEDYGCLVRARNPFNPRSIVYILAGSQTYGMKAAAEYLDSVTRGRATLQTIARGGRIHQGARPPLGPEYQVIVRVLVEKYFTSSLEVVASYAL